MPGSFRAILLVVHKLTEWARENQVEGESGGRENQVEAGRTRWREGVIRGTDGVWEV